MRAFIAIRLTEQVKDSLSKLEEYLKPNLPKVGWTKPASLHITLKFLGEITDIQLTKIILIASEITNTASAFKIRLDDLGVFPDFNRARIIWAGSRNNPQKLEKIAGDLATKLVKLGFPKEKRKFATHITLGRVKAHLNSSLLKETMDRAKKDFFTIQEFTPEGITIYKSILGASRSVYEILNEAKFKTS